MTLRHLRILGWILAVLCLWRWGWRFVLTDRGYASLLFGAGAVRFEVETTERPEIEVGPTPEFPFSSEVIPTPKPEGTIRIWLGSASHGEDIAVSVPDVFPNRMGTILEESILRP